MDLQIVLVIAHIIGVALGVGGATVSDIFFIRILRTKVINEFEFQNLRVLSRIVWAGITILILSGLSLLWLMHENTGAIGILNSPRFLAKLTLVAVVTLNGFIFHFYVFPKLKQCIDQKHALAKNTWLLAITGATSGASWYSIVLIAMLRFDWPYFVWIGLYLGVLLGGILTAKFLIQHLLRE